MKRQLNPIDKFKPLWEGGKSVEQYNIKVGFKIRMYCVNELNSLRQKNPSLFGQKETEELTKMIMDLKQDKGTINVEDQNCTLEDYQQFLSEFFQKIDYEDRHGTVTIKTSSKFRVMSSFIDVLATWGPIDEEMLKCKKYCQFKAVDIFKALKKGEVPRRGGPKEQENAQGGEAGLGNEIEELSKNVENANLGGGDTNDVLRGSPNTQPQPFTSYHSGGNNPYGGQQYNQGNNQYGTQYGQIPNNSVPSNNNGFSNPFGNANNNNNFNNNNTNKHTFIQKKYKSISNPKEYNPNKQKIKKRNNQCSGFMNPSMSNNNILKTAREIGYKEINLLRNTLKNNIRNNINLNSSKNSSINNKFYFRENSFSRNKKHNSIEETNSKISKNDSMTKLGLLDLVNVKKKIVKGIHIKNFSQILNGNSIQTKRKKK